jgi:hypothetical protein
MNRCKKRHYLDEVKACDKLPREEALKCMYEVLHEVTKEQDVVNIHLHTYLKETSGQDVVDPRIWAALMADNANAIILEVCNNHGRPKMIVGAGFVKEKIGSLNSNWDMLNYDAQDTTAR